jgi:hypothetical protein
LKQGVFAAVAAVMREMLWAVYLDCDAVGVAQEVDFHFAKAVKRNGQFCVEAESLLFAGLKVYARTALRRRIRVDSELPMQDNYDAFFRRLAAIAPKDLAYYLTDSKFTQRLRTNLLGSKMSKKRQFHRS